MAKIVNVIHYYTYVILYIYESILIKIERYWFIFRVLTFMLHAHY